MPRGKQLPVQEPGGAHIADRSIKNLALVGGVLGCVSSHAARHGAIRDTAYIKQKIQGVAKSAVTATAGHTEQATASGLTRAYVGPLQQTLYNMRAADPLQDRLAPVVAESPVDLHCLQPSGVDKYMDDYEMKRTDLKLRRAATGCLQKERISAWEKQERDREAHVHNTPNVALPKRNLLPGTDKVIVPISTSNFSIAPVNNITANMASLKSSSNSREVALTSTKGVGTALSEKSKSTINVSQGHICADKETCGEKEILIDLYLLELDQNPDENVDKVDQDEYKALTQMLFPSREDNASNTNEALKTAGYMDVLVEPHLIDIMQPSQDSLNPLTINPDDFVRFFSSINTFKYTGSTIDKVRAAATLLEGNNRDTRTLLEFYCGIKNDHPTFQPLRSFTSTR